MSVSGTPRHESSSRSRDEAKRRTLLLLSAVALALLALPLAVALGFLGGDRESLVVGLLPFQSPPAESDLERTATEVVEGLHARFRDDPSPSLTLIGPTVTQRFRDSREMPEALGRQIGADVVVVGGLRPEGEGAALLSAALIRVEDGRSLWTGELELPRPVSTADRAEIADWLWSRLRRALRAARVPS